MESEQREAEAQMQIEGLQHALTTQKEIIQGAGLRVSATASNGLKSWCKVSVSWQACEKQSLFIL